MGGLLSAWGCFPLVVRVFQPIYSQNILTGVHRGTCNLIREIQSCTGSSGEQQDRQGSVLTNKGKVLLHPSKVQKAGPVVVMGVSHRLVFTRQTHSDQAGQDQARKSICGSARLGMGIPTSRASTQPPLSLNQLLDQVVEGL